MLREAGYTTQTAPKTSMAVQSKSNDNNNNIKRTPKRPPTEALCPFYREGLKECNNPKCNRKHKGRTGKVCSSKDYSRYGFCKDISMCKDKHPWNPERDDRKEKLAEYQKLQKTKQGDSSTKIVATVHPAQGTGRFSPPSGRSSPSWVDAGPPMLSPCIPATPMLASPSMAMDVETPPDLMDLARVGTAPAMTAIDRDRLHALINDVDLEELFAAIEDEDLEDAAIDSEEGEQLAEEMARHCRVSGMTDSTGILSATVTATDESWDPDSGTGECPDDDEDDELAYAILSEGTGEMAANERELIAQERAMRQALELQLQEQAPHVEELEAMRDQLLKAHSDYSRVQANTEHSYLGHSLSPEATAMRRQMLVCEHTVMGRGHMHTTENGDKEFRPSPEGDTELISLTDDKGKQIFVFMPHAPATATPAPAPAAAPVKATPSGHVALYPASFVFNDKSSSSEVQLPELHRNRADKRSLD